MNPEQNKKRQKHNYTSELELKSLLIRIKNRGKKPIQYNKTINKYILWFNKINNKKYENPSRRNMVKAKLKERLIYLSEISSVDKISYERFGEIILLMIKNILKKPNFSGYTYRDEFYSDAVYKILKYLNNFDHLLISEITGQLVNSFAYISQIIHNSILFIINTKKKETDNVKKHISMEMLTHDLSIKHTQYMESKIDLVEDDTYEKIVISKIKTTLVDKLKTLNLNNPEIKRFEIFYPKSYRISFDEYNEIKPLLNGKISLMRIKND